eukprot:CAMPEP_0117418178 /NCGR_PEP_ID=MMETSP0758-20121206/20_1 /TAXON_ID=63605 /ORGANISM="Percolomonas cosmopolitus, Strain AE-1 (ATCC 50343)" /LENGTH=481 /DNA_ID=CAMNT_0005198543 /DNA_START=97 /DNA_END=1542 /DNA_ORIENTATION=+
MAIDGSGSIQRDDFIKQVEFVKLVSEKFNIKEDAVHFGIVQFGGHGVREEIKDSNGRAIQGLSSDAKQVKEAIDNIRQNGGSTPLDQALSFSLTQFQHVDGRPFVNKVLILLTDGGQSPPTNPVGGEFRAADVVKSNGVMIFSIGVGDFSGRNVTLSGIASSPSSSFVHEVDSFNALNNIIGTLSEETCIEVLALSPDTGCLGETTEVSILGRGFKNLNGGSELACKFGMTEESIKMRNKKDLPVIKDLIYPATYRSDLVMTCTLPKDVLNGTEVGTDYYVEITLNGITFTNSRRIFKYRDCSGAYLFAQTMKQIGIAVGIATAVGFPLCCLLCLICLLGLLLGLCLAALCGKRKKKKRPVSFKFSDHSADLLMDIENLSPPFIAAPVDSSDGVKPNSGYYMVKGRPVYVDWGRAPAPVRTHSMGMGDNFGGRSKLKELREDINENDELKESLLSDDQYEELQLGEQITPAKKSKHWCFLL